MSREVKQQQSPSHRNVTLSRTAPLRSTPGQTSHSVLGARTCNLHRVLSDAPRPGPASQLAFLIAQ